MNYSGFGRLNAPRVKRNVWWITWRRRVRKQVIISHPWKHHPNKAGKQRNTIFLRLHISPPDGAAISTFRQMSPSAFRSNASVADSKSVVDNQFVRSHPAKASSETETAVCWQLNLTAEYDLWMSGKVETCRFPKNSNLNRRQLGVTIILWIWSMINVGTKNELQPSSKAFKS